MKQEKKESGDRKSSSSSVDVVGRRSSRGTASRDHPHDARGRGRPMDPPHAMPHAATHTHIAPSTLPFLCSARSSRKNSPLPEEQREKLPELRRFDAIDALREPDAAQRRMSSMGVTIASIWEPTAGQIGCACSHLSLWQEAADAADPWTIILVRLRLYPNPETDLS